MSFLLMPEPKLRRSPFLIFYTAPHPGFLRTVIHMGKFKTAKYILLLTVLILMGAGSLGWVSRGTGSAKYDTFFGGEKSDHSHVAGSDLFWGFKKDWRGYFSFMGKLHSGRLGDYAVWTVLATALILVFVFCFMA